MRRRILLISLAITLLALILYSIISVAIFYNRAIDSSKENIKLLLYQFHVVEYSYDNDGAKLFSEDVGDNRITLIDSEGTVVGDSHYNYINMENHKNRPEIEMARMIGSGYDVRKSDTMDYDMLYYCEKLPNGDFIRIAMATNTITAMYVNALPALILAIAVDVAVCQLFAMILARYVLQPVNKFTRQAIEEQNYKTDDTALQPLAKQMQAMNNSMQRQLNEITSEKEIIEQVQLSKQEFISNVSHEMLTPLTSIKGYSEWLVSGKLNQEQTEKSCSIIAMQAEKLSNLIKCIVDYNQIDNDNMELYDVNLSKIAQEIISTLLPSIQARKIKLTTYIDEDVIVSSRQERISQIMGNLIRNAIKYNVDNGTITISIKDYRGKIVATVADTGVGIAEENIEKVFSRFFTVDKSHSGQNGGFGLGLAVCKKICQKQDWSISVRSKLHEGTTFTVVMS